MGRDAQRLSRWVSAVGLHRPELRAWAMYDWANSAMVTIVITAVFPIFYGRVACQGMDPAESTRRFAFVTTLAMAIVAVVAPVLGSLADTRPIKKTLLGGFLTVGVFAVAGMFWIRPGDWVTASILFLLANVGAAGSFVFYDALLPHVARVDEVDRVSTSGYALGYLGGGLLLALNLAWIQKPEWFGLPSGPGLTPDQQTLPTRLAFLSVAAWWGLFSIPLFLRVAEPPVRARAAGDGRFVTALRAPFIELARTFGRLKLHKQAFLMLLAFLVYNDGIGTIIRMATKYGEEIGINTGVMIASLVVTQFVGIPFAFAFGLLSRRVSTKTLILLCLSVYVGICVFGYFMTAGVHFLLLAILVATVQGGSQALSRSLFASLIPRSQSGEFFGFFAVAEKFAGIFGPALFGASLVIFGSTRAALLSIIAFFVAGALILTRVDVKEGRRMAQNADPQVA